MLEKTRETAEYLLGIYCSAVESGSVLKSLGFAFSMVLAASVIQYSRGFILGYQGYYEGREYIEVGFGTLDPLMLTGPIFAGFLATLTALYVLSIPFEQIEFGDVFNAFSYATVVGPVASLAFNAVFFGLIEFPVVSEFYVVLFLTISALYISFLYLAYRGIRSMEVHALDSTIITVIFSLLWPLTILMLLAI